MATIIPPKPEYNRLDIPESFRLNEKFEHFVLNTLFPESLYTLLAKDQNVKLKDNATGVEFYIHCEHRFSLIANNFTFPASPHIGSGKSRKKIFLVLGLGGTADAPYEIFLTDFEDCPQKHLYKRHLKNKSISTNQAVGAATLWKDVVQLKRKERKRA